MSNEIFPRTFVMCRLNRCSEQSVTYHLRTPHWKAQISILAKNIKSGLEHLW